ncbi:hypothetical protein JOD29_000841 [Lysinibacillus composti]|uniref:Uncharacterized protein n=1 Tax=Lysinibacillus composti TaxID=720633 RepID=A0A3N9UIK9_9BACI|nr:hypothetical protein [Lysinibacillus composti]MBM7607597.1 hypothetical protein [Lysinibacillus composti]RQW75899.1 hypothetical protein EBB45_04595 [Lysinibacillus composti]
MGLISVVGTVFVGGYIVCVLAGKRGILTDIISLGIDVANGMVDKYVHDHDINVKEKVKQIEMKRVKVEQVKDEEPGKYELYL